jgi:hypothetical protein
MQNRDAHEAIEPTERIEPTEPIDSTEPFEQIDSTECSDQSDHFELSLSRRMATILNLGWGRYVHSCLSNSALIGPAYAGRR